MKDLFSDSKDQAELESVLQQIISFMDKNVQSADDWDADIKFEKTIYLENYFITIKGHNNAN